MSNHDDPYQKKRPLYMVEDSLLVMHASSRNALMVMVAIGVVGIVLICLAARVV